MTTCISHWTALHWYLRRVCWSSVMASDGDEPRVPDVGPTAAEVADVMRALEPYLPEVPGRAPSIDVLVASDRGRRKIAGVTSHVCSTPLPRGSIQPTGLRGYDIVVTSPELTFIQIAATEDLRVAAYVGMALCSSFRLDDFSTSGLARREEPEEPLTSVKKIAAYLRRAKGLYGVDEARRALRYVRDGALSPPEGGIGLLAMLPCKCGGFGWKDVRLNVALRVFDRLDSSGRSRYTTRYPDVVIEGKTAGGERRMVGIDFDPEVTHGGEAKRKSDVRRGNQISGVRRLVHFTFTEDERTSYPAWRSSMERIRRALGKRKARRDGKADDYDNERWEAWHLLLNHPPVL